MATLLMRPGDGGNADKKRRARKGKNAQKKQPQRGLGVAQLEKLRLQEQSLLCATPPSYSLRLSATDLDHPLARGSSDVSQTILSLTTSNVHAQAAGGGPGSSVLRVGEAGTLSRLRALNGHSTTQSCISQTPLGHEVNKAIASRALACLSQSSNKFASVNASVFSNVLTATQLQILESQAQAQQKVDERRAAEQSGNAASYIFPSISNYLKEAPGNRVNDEGFKLLPAFKNHVGATTNIVRTNSTKELSSFQSYPSQQQAWPAAEKVSGRKRPWLAIRENGGQGCYAQTLDLNAPVEESDAGENERSPIQPDDAAEFRVGAHYTTGIVRNALGNSSLPVGVKVSTSGSHWQNNENSSPQVAAYFPEMGMYSENAIAFRHSSSQSSIKDSCSSATGGSSTYFSRNRQTSLSNPEIPSLLVEKESICSNFLTLGISTSSYPDRTGWNEPEESIQDNTPTSMNDVSRLRQETTTSGCEGDNDGSQVRKSICMQIAKGIDLKGGLSRSLSLEFDDGGGRKKKSSMLLHDSLLTSSSSPLSLSLPPPPVATNSPRHTMDENTIHYNPSPKSAQIVEEILDLRLKLAL